MKEQIFKTCQNNVRSSTLHKRYAFFKDGMLDSFDMVTQVNELDSTFGKSIDGVDILWLENFSSVETIAALLVNKGVK